MSTSVAGLSVAGLCQLPGLHSPLCEPGVVFLEGRGTGVVSVSVNDPCESPLLITGHHGFNICCELDIRVPGTQWGGSQLSGMSHGVLRTSAWLGTCC